MRRFLAIIGLGALILSWFALPATATSARPFSGSVRGEGTFPWVGDECPAGGAFLGNIQTRGDGTGHVTHLGRVTMTAIHCTPASTQLQGGHTTLVAANGDELYLTYAGIVDPFDPATMGPGSLIEGRTTMDVTGGTGRFEDADGKATQDFVATVAAGQEPWPVTWVWYGWISY